MLTQAGIDYTIRVTDIDETIVTTNNPIEKVQQLAMIKGESIPIAHDEVVLAADTVVAFNDQIFDKPKTEEEAYAMISRLSGESHEVYTGVFMRSHQQVIPFVEKTVVEFWPLEEAEIRQYVQTKEPYDKAGGYGIQSVGALFVKQIIGDYYNVVGLPLSRVVRELRQFNACSK